MDYIKDIGLILNEGLHKLPNYLRYIPLMVAIQVVVSLLMEGSLLVIGGIGVVGGILLAIIRAGLYSLYLFGLRHAMDLNNYKSMRIQEGLMYHFRDVYVAFFVIYILQLLASTVGIPYFDLILMVVFSALPEAIYLGTSYGFDNLTEALEFIKENWYFWIPLTFLMGAALSAVGYGTTLFVPILFGRLNATFIVRTILHLLLWTIFALIRGVLFKIMYQSSMRKRKYMSRFYS